MNRPESGIYIRAQVAEKKWDSVLIEHLTSEQFDFQFSNFDKERLSAFLEAYHKFVTGQLLPYVSDLEAVQARAKESDG